MAGTELDEAALRAAAGATGYEWGQAYVSWVRGLRVTETTAVASIQAQTVYLVDLQWSGDRLLGRCTCPHHAAGNFCKHLVALGLAVLELRSSAGVRHEAEPAAFESPLPRLPSSRPADAAAVSAGLVQDVAQVFQARGELGYHGSLHVAEQAEQVLHELEGLVRRGEARTAQQPLLRVVTLLRRVLERADDSAGALGDACQRAAELYAEACRAGHPDPGKLARWLLSFRATSPGWPELRLEDVAAAFDDRAWGIYRAGVARLQQGSRGRVDAAELQQMRLELADHDDDVETAVAILGEGGRPRYGAIVDRLRTAGRDDDVGVWIHRALEAGRVGTSHDDWRLSNDEVARDLLSRGREDAALEVHRSAVRRARDVRPFQALLEFAELLGCRDRERDWALGALRSRATDRAADGALLVQVALAGRDLPAAWAAADELGPGHAWKTLANAAEREFPGKAARLHRDHLETTLALARPDTYPEVAATLVKIGHLMASAGEEAEFAAYVATVRERFARRPALMAALDRRGLG